MRPDRIALFGYAHVPWFKKHQIMIDEAWLPGPGERLAQCELAAGLILAAGYVPVGIDHFALPDDPLAEAARAGRLRRNFQGYTDDTCETLIGFGPSSVGRYAQGYAQNVTATGEYQHMLAAGRLPVVRGCVLSDDDRIRGWAIERLMCDFALDGVELRRRFGDAAQPVIAIARHLASNEEKLLLSNDETFLVPAAEKALVRTVASRFDAFVGQSGARHSLAV